jgi:hypothetical protein
VATRLRKPTVAVCEWLVTVKPDEVAENNVGGRVPATILEKIIETVRSVADPPTPE